MPKWSNMGHVIDEIREENMHSQKLGQCLVLSIQIRDTIGFPDFAPYYQQNMEMQPDFVVTSK
jgi:hypothetical protein